MKIFNVIYAISEVNGQRANGQTFLDANEVIEESDLSEDMKGREKAKVLDARKCAIGSNFRLFPPWDSSSPP